MTAPATRSGRRSFREPVWSLLYQDEVWRPGNGPEVPLETLAARHLRNLRAWLYRNADGLSFSWDWAIAASPLKAAEDVPLSTDEYRTAEAWLEATPLLRRVDQLLEVDDYACVMAACDPVSVHG